MNSSLRPDNSKKYYYPGHISLYTFEHDLFNKRRELENKPSRQGTVQLIDELLKLEPFHSYEKLENVFALRTYIKNRIRQMSDMLPTLEKAVYDSQKNFDICSSVVIDENFTIPSEIALQEEAIRKSAINAKKSLSDAIENRNNLEERLKLFRRFLDLIDKWHLFFPPTSV